MHDMKNYQSKIFRYRLKPKAEVVNDKLRLDIILHIMRKPNLIIVSYFFYLKECKNYRL